MFSENKGNARKRYREFITNGVSLKKSEVYATVDQRLQGSEEFVERVLEHHDGCAETWRKKKEYSLEQIARAIGELHGVSKGELQSPTRARHVTYGRRIFSETAKEYGYKGTEVAAYLSIEPASVTGYDARRGELKKAIKEMVRHLEMIKT